MDPSSASFYKSAPATTRGEPCPTVLLAEPRDSTGSSSPLEQPHWHTTNKAPTGDAGDDGESSPPITLGLAIRRARLVGFTVSMVVIIVGLTIFFRHGVALTYFDSHAKNATQQTKLLDDYNSYSGNVASIFAKPIELFVTVAVQVIVLRFMAGTFTRPEMSWKTSAITLLLGAGIGYLIGNGFNALNVQLRPQPVETIIVAEDLYLHMNFTDDNRSSWYAETVPESNAHNVITNTVLRSAVTPKQFRGSTDCGWESTNPTTGAADEVKEAFVNLGFMQRDWQGRILQEAVPPTALRVVVNPTSKTANAGLNSASLPMNASLAAELFYHAITMGTSFFPWGKELAFVNRSDIARRYPLSDSNPHDFQDSTTRLYGLLPPQEDTDESAQKAWLVRESAAAMARQFAFAERTKTSDLVLEFSHTQLTPTIGFDAVTFEVEIDPTLLATAVTANNGTRYTVLDPLLNCPVSERCMIQKPSYGLSDTAFDPPAQVFALSMCLDENNNEVLRSNFTRQNTTTFGEVLDCPGGDGHLESVLTVSIAKRLVADALTQNMTASSNGTSPDPEAATVTNLRKIYSFTVGRLVWEFTDLAKEFNARCAAHDEDDPTCNGLYLPLGAPLDTTVATTVEQRLIVGEFELPSDLLASPGGPLGLSRTNLVVLDEPPQSTNASELYNIIAGDVLLLHNVANVTWDPVVEETFSVCSPEVEDRIIQTLNNHLYMEYGLQTAYTSAMYFVFMYGSVKDVIRVDATHQSLAFDGNKQAIAVWASTPAQNMWLTLTGCVVLVGGLLAALAKATWFTKKGDALANITQPQAIARVIVDERNYPPLFLHRRVLERQGTGRIDDYAIAGVSLQQQQEQEELQHRRRLQDAGMLA